MSACALRVDGREMMALHVRVEDWGSTLERCLHIHPNYLKSVVTRSTRDCVSCVSVGKRGVLWGRRQVIQVPIQPRNQG